MCAADAVDAADVGESVVKSVPKLTTPHDCFPLFLLNPIKAPPLQDLGERKSRSNDRLFRQYN